MELSEKFVIFCHFLFILIITYHINIQIFFFRGSGISFIHTCTAVNCVVGDLYSIPVRAVGSIRKGIWTSLLWCGRKVIPQCTWNPLTVRVSEWWWDLCVLQLTRLWSQTLSLLRGRSWSFAHSLSASTMKSRTTCRPVFEVRSSCRQTTPDSSASSSTSSSPGAADMPTIGPRHPRSSVSVSR